MDNNDYRKLFEEIVASRIYQNEMGLTELPLDALREFHLAAGLQPNQACTAELVLPGGADGLYNYSMADVPVGSSCAVMGVSFYDAGADVTVPIDGGDGLHAAMVRDFLNGKSLISGDFAVDQDGGIYFESSYSDDIGASILVRVPQDSEGVLLISEDLGRSIRIWCDGDKLFVAPSYIFIYDGPPS